jgi:hypothetical protein
MKLFVWENLFRDYTCGLAVVLAESEEQARTLLRAKMAEEKGYVPDQEDIAEISPWKDLDKGPTGEYPLDAPVAFFVGGGG